MKRENEYFKKGNKEEIKAQLNQGADHLIFKNARILRDNLTEAESLLWEELRLKRLEGFKFRRQHPVGIHILDFYCHKRKLGIEIDGGYHDSESQKKLDTERTDILNLQKIKIIRFRNEEIFSDLDSVLKKIKTELYNKNI